MNDVSAVDQLLNLDESRWKQFVQQVIKDLNLSGISIDWSVDIEPNNLYRALLDIVNQLLRSDPESLRNLLYRIDVQEETVTNSGITEHCAELGMSLTNQIILREIQKIINRSSNY